MRDIFELEKNTIILNDDSYINSYPHMRSYFQDLDTITSENVVLGSHMVYGWMPTILDLYIGDQNITLDELVEICNKAKEGSVLDKRQLEAAASVINNSLVGASKLLHFVNPNIYPIWDSKIYTFVHQKKPYNYRVNDASLYLDYLQLLSDLQGKPKFAEYHVSVNEKIGYEVTAVRAIEIIMFLNAPSI